MKFASLLFLLFFLTGLGLHAQDTLADSSSKEPVHILNAKNFYWKKLDAITELKILSGKVRLQQGNTLFDCDSCVVNSNAHLFEAFGNVHINDNDTTNIYSDQLRYLTNTKMAYLNGHVKM